MLSCFSRYIILQVAKTVYERKTLHKAKVLNKSAFLADITIKIRKENTALYL
ncbi:hypothetical protein NC652_019080 [Populus alba x Populus x berolinensis]|uniref:Uncharacterized protein n=1 Tax=Populus alba x Populus x berolinensis TaxID=444605 RepID=A0AAD6QHK0_9ROSI|nr:hypothetical protein NC652_019080 [Populus alba x Populus x berolinensis]KAJ6990506.1 hypothetical protein NC653_018921 [Populus alba x Populus x berolinensis]